MKPNELEHPEKDGYYNICNLNDDIQLQLLKTLDIPNSFIYKNLVNFGKNSIEWILNNRIQFIGDKAIIEVFEDLIKKNIIFPKSLITSNFIKKLFNERDIFQCRFLIENFSKNNNADLFNRILKKREKYILDNIDEKTGFSPKYKTLREIIENYMINPPKNDFNIKNSMDFFIHKFYQDKYYQHHRLELENLSERIKDFFDNLPNKSKRDYKLKGVLFRELYNSFNFNKDKIYKIIKQQNNIELSDTIIDYHFEDISYNVFYDIKELLNFQLNNGITIPIEHLKIYRDILNIDNLTIEEKINLHNKLKNINIIEIFYDDYSNSRDRMYQQISDGILNEEKIEQFKDESLSKKYGTNVYKFDGQEFFGLVRVSSFTDSKRETTGYSFSLVGKECIGCYMNPKIYTTFVYGGLEPNQIIHTFFYDSYSNSYYKPGVDSRISDYISILRSPSDLLKETKGFNELIILRKGKEEKFGWKNVGNLKPIALYCYDEISNHDIKIAKEKNIGIMLVITKSYKKEKQIKKYSINKDILHVYPNDDHLYVSDEDSLKIAINTRKIRTSFEEIDKLNALINEVTVFSIKEDINSPESIEKIRNAFSYYKNEVLPLILDNPKVTQKKGGYHGLHTHTKNVVFRGICYAVSLGEDPIPVVFACACHDLARVNDSYDEKHGKNAIPITTEIINNEKFNLTEEQKKQIVDAVTNHTTGMHAVNYISACLRDADRTRLSWEYGYDENFFNTEQGKIISSGNREDFIGFQNKFDV